MAVFKRHGVMTAIVIALCLAVLGSFLFIAFGSDHCCTHDDDCAVCRFIDMCIHNAQKCFFVIFAVLLIAVMLAAAAPLCADMSRGRTAMTLITLKTELRD